jgi:4-hydroxythreonine-4-phosphate dehydrogenase
MRDKRIIAIATGDPAGIGPEISLKAALDAAVRNACRPLIVSDPAVLKRHARACGIAAALHVITSSTDADWSRPDVHVLDCSQPELAALEFGTSTAAAGRAALAFAGTAIKLALARKADAVIAAPQNETSIALAGIDFDGHPSFVARETGSADNDVFLMLCFGGTKIVHCTLHQSVRKAISLITQERVLRAIEVTDRTLRQIGIAGPRIAVSGLNPHAGEGGLFGDEESKIITPAIDAAKEQGLAVSGPFGADTIFQRPGIDAFVVMLHDQGHIPAKLIARNRASALAIGSPILFASVAHGSAHDIAGKGTADPTAMIETVLRLAQSAQ